MDPEISNNCIKIHLHVASNLHYHSTAFSLQSTIVHRIRVGVSEKVAPKGRRVSSRNWRRPSDKCPARAPQAPRRRPLAPQTFAFVDDSYIRYNKPRMGPGSELRIRQSYKARSVRVYRCSLSASADTLLLKINGMDTARRIAPFRNESLSDGAACIAALEVIDPRPLQRSMLNGHELESSKSEGVIAKEGRLWLTPVVLDLHCNEMQSRDAPTSRTTVKFFSSSPATSKPLRSSSIRMKHLGNVTLQLCGNTLLNYLDTLSYSKGSVRKPINVNSDIVKSVSSIRKSVPALRARPKTNYGREDRRSRCLRGSTFLIKVQPPSVSQFRPAVDKFQRSSPDSPLCKSRVISLVGVAGDPSPRLRRLVNCNAQLIRGKVAAPANARRAGRHLSGKGWEYQKRTVSYAYKPNSETKLITAPPSAKARPKRRTTQELTCGERKLRRANVESCFEQRKASNSSKPQCATRQQQRNKIMKLANTVLLLAQRSTAVITTKIYAYSRPSIEYLVSEAVMQTQEATIRRGPNAPCRKYGRKLVRQWYIMALGTHDNMLYLQSFVQGFRTESIL
ncbi:hypothetical protein EVAR_2476_1 [Eumeta japonica]|uniref:Uncharacterized protein n=1 Tax=Eumeta variegata TaxID=151549 RepID=A0A4C1SNT1_EUMVA|nr:hypothetical protein EVAR_2476_1 [Eumeta japonica]